MQLTESQCEAIKALSKATEAAAKVLEVKVLEAANRRVFTKASTTDRAQKVMADSLFEIEKILNP